MKVAKVQRSYKDAAKNYSVMSRWYDVSEGIFEYYFLTLGLRLLDPHPDDKILEIGFGTGKAITKIANFLETGTITGIDIAPGMVKQTKRKLKNHPRRDRIKLIHANALNHDWEMYDKVFFSFSLELFTLQEIDILLDKCESSITSDGSIVIVALNRVEPVNLATKIYEYFHFQFPKSIDCRPIPVRSLLSTHGFTKQRYREMSMWGIPVIIIEGKQM